MSKQALEKTVEELVEFLSELQEKPYIPGDLRQRISAYVAANRKRSARLKRLEEALRSVENRIPYADLQAALKLRDLLEKMAMAKLWNEDLDHMEGDGVSRSFQEDRENEAQDWILQVRKLIQLDPKYEIYD